MSYFIIIRGPLGSGKTTISKQLSKLLNAEHILSVKFEKHLKGNPKALAEYEKLKSKADGQSIRKYYTLKTIFINKILKRLNTI